MRAALCQNHAPDCAAANRARLPFAAVHAMRLLKRAAVSVAVDIIGDRRAAVFDCSVKHSPKRVEQAPSARVGQMVGGAARMDARGEQRFVGIDIAYAR